MSSDTLQAMGMIGWEQMRGDKLVAPAWLAGLANDAKVEAFASKELSQFVTPKSGVRGAREVVLDMTGKQTCSSSTPLQSGWLCVCFCQCRCSHAENTACCQCCHHVEVC